MLDRLHIQNYKCLRDVTVDLGEFNILIGPNDSGKSSFLEVIQFLSKLTQFGYDQTFSGDQSLSNLVWRKESQAKIIWEAAGKILEKPFTYCLEFSPERPYPLERLDFGGRRLFGNDNVPTDQQAQGFGMSPGAQVVDVQSERGQQRTSALPGSTILAQLVRQGLPPYPTVANALRSSLEYRFDPDKLASPAVPVAGEQLDPSGQNLAAVLDVLQNSAGRQAFTAIQDALHSAIPTLQGFVLPPAPPPKQRFPGMPPVQAQLGAKAIEFILSGNGQASVTIPASLASVGALLLTAYLTLAYSETPNLLLLEEPENGLHPSRLKLVVDILRKISAGEVGNRKRQVILTTHNPLLLNYAHASEVRVFTRDSESGTRVTSMAKVPDIDRLLKEFAVGELWYLLGEEKLFEEQPA
jgi:predicted ATPase